jgi:hypothetical protein
LVLSLYYYFLVIFKNYFVNQNIDKYVKNEKKVENTSNSESFDDIDIIDQMDIDEEFVEDNILKIDNLPDINKIVDIYPKTISYQFPLLLLLTQKSKDNITATTRSALNVSFVGHLNENKFESLFMFQPFTEQFQEKFENYLQHRYEKIGQQLYESLVKQCNLWKHLRALSGMYFMLQGESMHQLCDVIFDRVCL